MAGKQAGKAENAHGEAPGGVETEIKLVGRSLDAPDLLDHPAVRALGPVETVSLRAVYLDTPDFALHRAAAALRVRAEGERFLLTLKSAGREGGLSRSETEVPVTGLEPDRDSLLVALPPDLASEVREAELRPVFRTEVERRKVLVDAAGGQIELALDKGTLFAGEHSEPINELELELKSGGTAALWRLARDLGAERGLRPSLLSKSARGYALAMGVPLAGAKSRIAGMKSGIDLDAALHRILHAAFLHLLENQPAAEDGRDVEGLHQFRVALRRLRALFKLMRDLGAGADLETLESQAKALMKPLNAARALDVFIGETLPDAASLLAEAGGADALKDHAERARREAYDRVRSAIAGPNAARFELELGAWIEERGWRSAASGEAPEMLARPAADFAASALKALHRKVLKRGRGFNDLPPPKRHKVRIAVKNLRYGADFFEPVLSPTKASKSFGRTLEEFQDRLGEANDLATLAETVRPLMTEALGLDGHTAAGAVLGWASARRQAEEDGLRAAWKTFKKLSMPW